MDIIERKRTSAKIANPDHIDTYRAMLADRHAPSGTRMPDRNALARMLAYELLAHYTPEQIAEAVRTRHQKDETIVATPVLSRTEVKKKSQNSRNTRTSNGKTSTTRK